MKLQPGDIIVEAGAYDDIPCLVICSRHVSYGSEVTLVGYKGVRMSFQVYTSTRSWSILNARTE